MIVEYHI